MRRDQLLFLIVGLVFGLAVGAIIGAVVARPDIVGASAPTPPAAGAPGAPPQAAAGMDSVDARLAALRARLDKNPDDEAALTDLGELYLAAGMRERAVEPFRRLAALAGNDPRRLTEAATAQLRAGDARGAFATARRAADLDRSATAPAALAAQAAIAAGGVAEAEDAVAELRRRAPNAPEAAAAAAGLAEMKRVVEDGRAKPNDYAAQVAAGNFFYDRGQWAEAEAAYRRALAVRADDPDVVTDHGVTLHQLGRDAEALAEFDRSIRLDPRHAMTALNGTVVSLAAGDKARAATWLARLEQIDPRHPAIPRFKEELGQK